MERQKDIHREKIIKMNNNEPKSRRNIYNKKRSVEKRNKKKKSAGTKIEKE